MTSTAHEEYQRFVELRGEPQRRTRIKLMFASTEIDVDRPHRIEIDETWKGSMTLTLTLKRL